MPTYNYPKVSLNKPISGGGGLLSGGNSNFMPSLGGTAARAGAAIATGGTSEIVAQVLNLIPSIFQGITGFKQMKQASIDKLTNYAYGQTLNQDIPGGEMYRNEIKGATAAGIKAASELGSGSEAYGMLGELVGRQQGAFGDLAKMTAQQVQGSKGEYMNALGVKANEENRVWNWNEADPYQQAAQIAQALRDSGLKNKNSALKNVFGSGAEYLSSTNPDFNSSLMWGKGNNKGTGSIDMASIMEAIKGLENG
jgi:hypothetical protein